jgi:hypothetical protein
VFFSSEHWLYNPLSENAEQQPKQILKSCKKLTVTESKPSKITQKAKLLIL